MIWEIRCLSRRYPIRLGKREIRWGESGVQIRSGDIVGVAGESFFFMLPKDESQTLEQEETKAQEQIEQAVVPTVEI
jgi:hypothetical protein